MMEDPNSVANFTKFYKSLEDELDFGDFCLENLEIRVNKFTKEKS